MDPRTQNLADILVKYSLEVKKGDWVVVRSPIVAEPLALAIQSSVLEAGGFPTINFSSSNFEYNLMKRASKDQLEWVSPLAQLVVDQADASINIMADDNTRAQSNIDPEKQAMMAASRAELNKKYMERISTKDLRWVGTAFPCQAMAQDADMSLIEYEDFVYGSTYADRDDPLAEWQRIHNEQQVIIDWLKGKREVTVKAPTADLTLSIEGRDFINSDGHLNMPSGEVYTSPVEDSCSGWVEFSYPAITAGREVEGVRLEFKEGKVVKASAEKNEEFLLKMLDVDAGARYLGEFAIGTNYGIQQFTKSILFDEKIGGTFHMALGFGFAEAGSKNKSAIHWDLICDVRRDSEIRVDGDLLYKDGQFQI